MVVKPVTTKSTRVLLMVVKPISALPPYYLFL